MHLTMNFYWYRPVRRLKFCMVSDKVVTQTVMTVGSRWESNSKFFVGKPEVIITMYTNLLSHYNYADTITEILIWEPGFSQS